MTEEPDLNQQTYDRCARVFEQIRKLLGLEIRMHHERRQIEHGEIFLFNHFARMETFIPQYLIYQDGGNFCRSVASAEFFARDDRFARLLRELGVVPNNHPQLMALLARDILRGRKVVVFPEGGMVKDRQVLDEDGQYRVYSRSAQTRRKHHSGAARLAIGLQIFRYAVQYRAARNQHSLLRQWAEALGMGSVDQLLTAAHRPGTLVPANITFYPLRISDNLLRQGAELVSGGLSPRAVDEWVVEGNLLLKATDMDINLGDCQPVEEFCQWYERPLLRYLARQLPDLPSVFDAGFLDAGLLRRVAARGSLGVIHRTRDAYMHAIYRGTVVNLSHLASTLVRQQFERAVSVMPMADFQRVLYLAVKRLQLTPALRLHHGLRDPGSYQQLLGESPAALKEFLDSAVSAGLLELRENTLFLLDKLRETHDFDAIRLENPIEVYANEVAPLPVVAEALRAALAEVPQLTPAARALALFDDEWRALAFDRLQHRTPAHAAINSRETATADAAPFLLQPGRPGGLAVVLVHGFLASPAEVRAFGERLAAAGHTVLGVRLKGHGTSPWDLQDRPWHDWLQSVTRGIEIVRALCPRYALVGFSTGGSLSLIAAANADPALVGVVAISAPLKFRNKNLRYVPLVHGANKLVSWLTTADGVLPFRPNEPEHPHINYRNIPLSALFELTRVVAELKVVLPAVRCPVCVIQGDADPVVAPESAGLILEALGASSKTLHWVPANRHGILYEDIGATRALTLDFLSRLAPPEVPA
jgi:esterase/lipase